METVLITGATGFIGANLARRLAGSFKVNILARPNSNFWRLNDIKSRLAVHNADICDYENLRDAVNRIRPDYIFHFAAYGAYPRIQADESKILETDIIGTHNLLKAALGIPYKCLINTGSSSEYGIKDKPMKEDDALDPNTAYGAAKAASTMLCRNFAREHDKPIITLRPFSVYGYYEERLRLVPDVIISCLKNKDVNLSSGVQKRDFVFIEDAIGAYMQAMKYDDSSGLVLNVGSGKDISVMDAANKIHKIINSGNRLFFGKKPLESFETEKCWRADIKLIRQKIGWKPKINLDEGLARTVEWFRGNMGIYS